MSDPHSDNEPAMEPPEPTFSNRTLTIFGIIGSFAIFLLILFIAYLPNRGAPAQQQVIDYRKAALSEYRSAEAEKMNSVEVVDAEAGKYKIPVEQAVELTLREFDRAGKGNPGS
ncbi:MAG: hypothetical protein ACFE0O_13660 [Opitutales bacterium]